MNSEANKSNFIACSPNQQTIPNLNYGFAGDNQLYSYTEPNIVVI